LTSLRATDSEGLVLGKASVTDAFVEASLAPWLEEHGFVAGKNVFVRFGEVTHFVELERSRFNSAAGESFRLTLGACVGCTRPRGKPTRKMLYESSLTPVVRPLARLGEAPSAYVFKAGMDAAAFAASVRGDLERLALPFVRETLTVRALTAWLLAEDARHGNHQNGCFAALYLLHLGERDAALAQFRTADGHRPTLVAMAKSLGLDLEE
jgi:hypothetical protein